MLLVAFVLLRIDCSLLSVRFQTIDYAIVLVTETRQDCLENTFDSVETALRVLHKLRIFSHSVGEGIAEVCS